MGARHAYVGRTHGSGIVSSVADMLGTTVLVECVWVCLGPCGM